MAMNRSISCIMLTPYIKFEDGTIGSILVINWDRPQPSVFLFDSQNRNATNPNAAKQRTLFPDELKMLTEYINKGEQKQYFFTGNQLKEAYSMYGVARLCGNFMSAHIADLICENINAHNPQYRHDTSRTKEQLAGAHLQYTNCNLEDELLLHMSNDSLWERSILEQALPMIEPGYNHNEWLDTILLKIRTAFISNLENNTTATFGADYGYRLATAYAEDPDVKWWRVLEEAVSMQHKETAIKYADFGFQQIIAFYGLSQYIAINKPWDSFTLNVANVPLPKRIELFKTYKDNLEKECMEELSTADNPLLSAMPTKQDAQKAAKERLKENLGKAPDWLPEEWRPVYSQYEQAFCKDIVEEKLNATVHKGFEAYIVKDHKKVMDILMFVAHLGNGQMPLMIKVVRALQNLNYIRQDCFEDFQLFIKNAEEQFSNINFDKANVRHNVEKGNNTLDKKYKDSVENIAKYLTSLL